MKLETETISKKEATFNKKEQKEQKEQKIDLQISKEYLDCLKNQKSHKICKELFEIFNKADL